MSASILIRHQAQETVEERLWRAVIASTVREWQFGPLRQQREAEDFLFHDEADYSEVCLSAGIDPAGLREHLRKIRPEHTAGN